MKTLIAVLSLVAMTAAHADCTTKQKNAASVKLADALGVLVQEITVVSYAHGAWTEAVGNNVGSDRVTVSGSNDRGLRVMEVYEVAGRQVGTTNDCNITSVKPARL